MKNLFRYLILATMIRCEQSEGDRGFEKSKSFYEKAKKHNDQLTVFRNTIVIAEGINPDDSLYMVRKITYVNEQLALPAIQGNMDENQISSLPFFENLKIYAKAHNLSYDSAYQEVKQKNSEIIDLMSELEVWKVSQIPRLGPFIIFSITDHDQVIYKYDTLEVDEGYWMSFFEKAYRFDNHWYYRKVSYSIRENS